MIRELFAYQSGNNELIDACGNDPGQICEWVFDASGNKTLSSIIGWAVDKPLTIIVVVLAGFIASRLMRKTITHFGERLTDERQSRALAQLQKIKGMF